MARQAPKTTKKRVGGAPDPLITRPAPPGFPLHTLPDIIRVLVEETADALQVPPDLPAAVALGVLSTAATETRQQIHIAGNWTETANLYMAVSMPPASGKSPAVKIIAKPLDELADRVAKSSALAAAQWDLEGKRIQQHLDNNHALLLKAEQRGDGHAIADAQQRQLSLLKSQLEHDERPHKQRQLIAEDVTPEAFVRLLDENGGRISVISTEGGLFDSLSRYAEKGAGPKLDALLQAWSGDSITVNRAGGQRIKIPEALAAITITVQPRIISQLFADADMTSRGLAPRFMISQPESLVGWRDVASIRGVPTETLEKWGGLVSSVANRPETVHTLTVEALDVFTQWRTGLEIRRRPGGDLSGPLAEITVKAESSTMRTAVLLALAQGITGPIPAGVVADAIEIGDYWIGHAQTLIFGNQLDPNIDLACAIVKWWAKREEITPLTTRDIQRSGVGSTRDRGKLIKPKSEDIDAALFLLGDYGWVDLDENGGVWSLLSTDVDRLVATDQTPRSVGQDTENGRLGLSRAFARQRATVSTGETTQSVRNEDPTTERDDLSRKSRVAQGSVFLSSQNTYNERGRKSSTEGKSEGGARPRDMRDTCQPDNTDQVERRRRRIQ